MKKMAASANARKFSARLAAVQVVYQAIHNAQDMRKVLEEHIQHNNPPQAEDIELPPADDELLVKIVSGVSHAQEDLQNIVKANYSKQDKEIEFLLRAILLCGAWELVFHSAVDAPVIINDYLNVARAFYESGEVGLVNGILDSIAKTART